MIIKDLILLKCINLLMKKVFLGLGSNLGERFELLKEAVGMVSDSAGNISVVSSIYETEPVGLDNGGDFLNMVISVDTNLTPSGLLGRIMMIESKLGRIRCETRNSSRTIDIDILLFGEEIIDKESLIVPHPRMHLRRFVLEPLNELAADFIHPVLGKSINALLKECVDKSMVTLFKDQF
jgi:deoxyguanosine kinase